MSKIRLVVLFVILVVATSCASVYAKKITLDPNLPGKQKPSDQGQADVRLSQKITYDSGYKRLYAVAEDLTQLSGVYIVCGSSKKDWRVRDVPVVICVKDMPLGKLLKTITDTTHTRLTADKIGDDPKLSYRIYRSIREETEIDSYFQRAKDADLEQIKWRWDAMVAYGKSDNELPGISKETKLLAKLIASLGPDAKSKMLNYETLQISGSNPATQKITDELYMLHLKELQSRVNTDAEVYVPTREDKDNVSFRIKLQEQSDSIGLSLGFHPIAMGEHTYSCNSIDIYEARSLPEKGFKLPAYPADIKRLKPRDDMQNPDMVFLDKYKDGDWNRPLLKDKKFDLIKPKDKKDFTLADIMREISAISGCNIVVEDFISQRAYTSQLIDGMFKKDTTIADTLRHENFGGWKLYSWFFNEEEKLMVGCVDDWRRWHRAMLSEEYMDSLKTKIDGPGVDVDDVVHFGSLSIDSYYDWIQCKDLECLANTGSSHEALWLLYDALQSGDKLLAKSDNGLPLAKFDCSWITGFCYEQRKQEISVIEFTKRSDTEKQKLADDLELKNRIMLDPQVISTIVMRVQQKPATYRSVTRFVPNGTSSKSEKIPEGMKLYNYNMVIDFKIDGEDRNMEIKGPHAAFPIWSAKREAEILKGSK